MHDHRGCRRDHDAADDGRHLARDERPRPDLLVELGLRAGPHVPPDSLSGGNQQKVAIAAAIVRRPNALVLEEPTRGVDIGAKSEIFGLCDRLARQGMALLFSSSEIEETLGVCDRVLVFYKGLIIREFARGEATKADVMHWVAGGVIPEV
ncbi:MAG: ATP-binding cassette domain-containing protein, partial [Actinobacteria bacterium]|nr:ATP-binding cassette domain-containing protein [Actinomycetota bacterium]